MATKTYKVTAHVGGPNGRIVGQCLIGAADMASARENAVGIFEADAVTVRRVGKDGRVMRRACGDRPIGE